MCMLIRVGGLRRTRDMSFQCQSNFQNTGLYNFENQSYTRYFVAIFLCFLCCTSTTKNVTHMLKTHIVRCISHDFSLVSFNFSPDFSQAERKSENKLFCLMVIFLAVVVVVAISSWKGGNFSRQRITRIGGCFSKANCTIKCIGVFLMGFHYFVHVSFAAWSEAPFVPTGQETHMDGGFVEVNFDDQVYTVVPVYQCSDANCFFSDDVTIENALYYRGESVTQHHVTNVLCKFSGGWSLVFKIEDIWAFGYVRNVLPDCNLIVVSDNDQHEAGRYVSCGTCCSFLIDPFEMLIFLF